MRWWAVGGLVVAMVVVGACSSASGGGSGGSRSASVSGGASATPSVSPTAGPSEGRPAGSGGGCVVGRVGVVVSPGGPVERRVCVRPGAVVALTLKPRTDDKRWTGVLSSAPGLVVVADWRVGADGTAPASLRCAGTRGGTAKVTARAKAPDVAGAARVAFLLDVSVVPYPKEGGPRSRDHPSCSARRPCVSRSRAP